MRRSQKSNLYIASCCLLAMPLLRTPYCVAQAAQEAAPAVTAESAAAPAAAPAANPYKGSYLFGDWDGSRLAMAQHGVNFDASFTQFGQALSGQPNDTVDNYANKFDLYLNVDTQKAGLWRGGGIGAHMEVRYNDSPQGTELFPANTALFTPSNGPNRAVLTSLYLTQKVNATSAIVFGKINTIDLLAPAPFIGGRGLDGFMHIAFAAPPSGVVPVVTYGALYAAQVKKVALTVFVFDPQDQTSSDLTPFQKGVNFSVGATLPTKTFGHNATHTLSGTFSTMKGVDLADIPQLLLPPGDRVIGTNRGPFNISYQYEQFLYQNPTNPRIGWGLFAAVSIADGNPNPIQNTLLLGLGGTGLTARRQMDRFGIGYYRDGLSNALKDALAAPPVGLKLNNESGAEIFYNFAVTRWFGFTPDFQVHAPTLATKGTIVFGALRAKVSF